MRDWVIPILKAIRPETISEESYSAELTEMAFVWRRVANLFLHEFDSEGMRELLGSVLVDLWKKDFDKLVKAYPFFILARTAAFCQMIHTPGNVPIVVFVESDLLPMSWEHRRAIVGHECAHVILNHLTIPFSLDDPWRQRQQDEADALCREWDLDIDGVRKFLERRKSDG